jgi:hypothetical protein
MVCTTFELVQVMVGTRASAVALVSRLVLMYTTWRLLGVAAAWGRWGQRGGDG